MNRKPRLLYVECGHPTQGADDCIIWSKLGFEWYSTGYYAKENGIGQLPKIDTFYSNNDYYNELNKYALNVDTESKELKERYLTFTGINIKYKWLFSKEFCSKFDVFVFNHSVDNIIQNIKTINQCGNKLIILKTFGMHEVNDEILIKHLLTQNKIIRISNSPVEKLRSGYAGENGYINSCVIPSDDIINDWIGNKNQVCTFTNCFNYNHTRDNYRRFLYLKIKQNVQSTNNCRFILGGANNESEPLSIGFTTLDEKLDIMRQSRVHLVTGTPNSSITYSLVESMMMGAPVVCYGKHMWQSNIYLANTWFNHGENILIGESAEECATYIDLLLKDDNMCKFLGNNARKKAIELYGRDNTCKKWKKLFNENGIDI